MVFLAGLVFYLLSAIFEAMSGNYGLGWQVVTWIGALVIVLALVGPTVVALDQKFGWGLTNPPSDTPDTPEAHTRTPEDVLGDDAPNYGVAEPRSPLDAEPGLQQRRGQWQPHPHDPQRPPGDASTQAPTEGDEQTEYAVILKDVGAKKISVIKVVRAATGLNLTDAKNLVDEAPNIVKEELSRSDAEALKAELERAGATVELW